MTSLMITAREWHYGRSWTGHLIEDECMCEQAPCGLVTGEFIWPDCPQHSPKAAKTMRQGHQADKCPEEKPRGSVTVTLAHMEGTEPFAYIAPEETK
jgi:hypothetical protein